MTGEYFEVGTNDDLIVEFPAKVETIASGPCLVIGILDRGKNIGYLGHYTFGPASGAAVLIDEAVSSASSIGDLEVVLAGNRRDGFDTDPDHGQWALDLFKLKGIDVQNKMIYDSDEIGYTVMIDTEKETIILEELKCN